jgi:3'-phosphoadenosine 5'-phosphosulfate sulfotransferase (PAPS reductase)/FAD synthetase
VKRNEIAALHARTDGYKRKLERARDMISRALATPNAPPYVALSGGKDSTVVYALVREQCPDVPAVWSDDEWYLPETLDYIRRLQGAGLDVRQIRTNAVHAPWLAVSGDWDGIPHYARMQNWGLCFLGLRQEESSARRVHLRTFGPLFFALSDDFWHCNPIHDWTWRDVWAYIVSVGLDYNRAYDRLEEIGVEPEHQRVGPLAVERALGYGQLAILKRGWPDLYNRFVATHPEASAYT